MKFFGKVGYGTTEEVEQDVWEKVVVERTYGGDVIRDTRRFEPGDSVNDNLRLNNSFSIVADAYANEHFNTMLYIEWQGVRWSIKEVESLPPRLLLRLGGVYNGPTPVESPPSSE